MSTTLSVVEFEVFGTLYALDIELAREIVEMLPITPVPRAPSYISGIINLRGEITNIINLNVILGIKEQNTNDGQKIIVLVPEAAGGSNAGIIVDNVHAVLEIQDTDVEKLHDDFSKIAYVKGIIRFSDKSKTDGGTGAEKLIIWIDIRRILSDLVNPQAGTGGVKAGTKLAPSPVPVPQIIEEEAAAENISSPEPEDEPPVEKTPSLPSADTDQLGEFLAARCERLDDERISARDLYAAYREWADRQGRELMTMQKFGRRLSKHGLARTKDRKGLIVYKGIALT